MEQRETEKNRPKAPKDPERKRSGFYIMREKEIAGSPQPDGRGIQFLYMDSGRLVSCARIAGGVTEERILDLLQTVEGFRRLVHSIGIVVEGEMGGTIDFVFQMYAEKGSPVPGTEIRRSLPVDGMEYQIALEDCSWSEADDVPGQIRFEFAHAGEQAAVSVKLYLQDGYEAPEQAEEVPVDLGRSEYQEMLHRSLVQTGNPARLQKALQRARKGEDITIAFIGGSITQGAGAVPIHTQCYAYQTYKSLCSLVSKGTGENIHYRKAGVGGTPSELGMLRYDRDVVRDSVKPDIVVVEFAVNDMGDETGGVCYDSLVRKILAEENAPAVILLFAVFVDDWNLQERLGPVGEAYDLPMVSIRDAVVEQFYKKPAEGRVFSKNQFFYDCFHPSNLGHTVMADCLLYLFQTVDKMPTQEDTLRIEQITPPLGGEFERVRFFDRSGHGEGIVIDCGSFCHYDEELQAVEMDEELEPTKEFPYNWMYRGEENGGECRPFSVSLVCSALLLVYKDSGSNSFGRAKVWVDGKEVLTADPHVNGWTHCNPVICLRQAESRRHQVEIRMAEGEQEKEFTILGFGYVE